MSVLELFAHDHVRHPESEQCQRTCETIGNRGGNNCVLEVLCMRSDRALARWREAEAVRLRLEGLDYHSIAKALGYRTRSAAWKAVDRALRRTTVANVEQMRDQVLVDLLLLQERAWAEACAGKLGAFDRSLRALDQRARIAGLYPGSGPPDWDGVKQPIQRTSRPRPRSTWREPADALKPHGFAGESESAGCDDPDRFLVLKHRTY